jgi:hypothetical protein
MKVIEGRKGKKGSSKQSKADKEGIRKHQYMEEFLKNLNKLIPVDEVLDKTRFEFTMTKDTPEEGLRRIVLTFKEKKPNKGGD